MRRPRYVEVRSLNDTLMLLLTGAVAGTAAGVYLGRRYGSVGALVDDVRHRLLDAWDSWNDDELEGDELEGELESDALEHEALEEAEALGLPDEEAFDELEPEGFVGAPFDEPFDEPLKETRDELEPVDPADTLPPRREASVADIPSAEPSRRSLETRVLDRFETDEILRRRAVDIAAVGEGVIELTGWVRSGEEAARAAAMARAVSGVEMVLNRITVRSPEELADDAERPASRPTTNSATPPTGGLPRTPPEGMAP